MGEIIKGDMGVRGPQGRPGTPGFTYEDFTAEQLEALRGPQGKDGDIIKKATASGTALKIADSSDSNIITLEMGIADNPTIKVYGKNIFNGLIESPITINGVTIANEKGGISVTGTPTAQAIFTLHTNLILSPNNYIFTSLQGLSGYDTGLSVFINLYDKATGGFVRSRTAYSNAEKITITAEECKIYKFSVGVVVQLKDDGVIHNTVIYPQLEVGTVATEYEQYKVAQEVTIPQAFTSLAINNGVVTIDGNTADVPELTALHTNYPNTTILCDVPVTVVYKADATKVINNMINRIEALEVAISNT